MMLFFNTGFGFVRFISNDVKRQLLLPSIQNYFDKIGKSDLDYLDGLLKSSDYLTKKDKIKKFFDFTQSAIVKAGYERYYPSYEFFISPNSRKYITFNSILADVENFLKNNLTSSDRGSYGAKFLSIPGIDRTLFRTFIETKIALFEKMVEPSSPLINVLKNNIGTTYEDQFCDLIKKIYDWDNIFIVMADSHRYIKIHGGNSLKMLIASYSARYIPGYNLIG
jgi:hypothetical protein